MEWTGENVEYLRKNWKHYSATELGAYFGCTRNAVIGKARRLNLPPKKTGVKREKRVLPKRARIDKHLTEKVRKARAKAKAEPKRTRLGSGALTPGQTDTLHVEEREHKKVPLRDLKKNIRECRWIIGQINGYDTIFCGDPVVEGKSWCPEHHRLVFPPR